jgi:hypothetical protein
MKKCWYFYSRMSFETYGNCCQMLLYLLKLSRSGFFNISSVGFIKGLLSYINFEQNCVVSPEKLNWIAWFCFISGVISVLTSASSTKALLLLCRELSWLLREESIFRIVACSGVLVAAWRSSELPAEESLWPLGDLQHCLQSSLCGRLEIIGMLKQISKLTNSNWNGECRAVTLIFFRATKSIQETRER